MILSKSVLIARKKWSDGLCMIGQGNPAFEKCYNSREWPSKKNTESHRMRHGKQSSTTGRKEVTVGQLDMRAAK